MLCKGSPRAKQWAAVSVTFAVIDDGVGGGQLPGLVGRLFLTYCSDRAM